MSHCLFGLFFSLGLEGHELGHVLVAGPLDALLVDREELEIVGLLAPGSGLGEGVIDLGKAGAVGGVPVHAESERARLDGAGALEAPLVGGDGLNNLALKIGCRGEGFLDDLAVFVEGLLLCGSGDADLAGESVAIGVQAATRLAFGGFGTCGAGRVRGWSFEVVLLF